VALVLLRQRVELLDKVLGLFKRLHIQPEM
jgi:hypothetical protein